MSDFLPERPSTPLSPAELLALYPTREMKIQRIREVEKRLSKMENEDEENDPTLVEGHIRLTRGTRMGCGVFLVCLAALCFRAAQFNYPFAKIPATLFAAIAVMQLLRGWFYRPDPKLILESYKPHRGSSDYRALVSEMDQLARAISQDLHAEDAG